MDSSWADTCEWLFDVRDQVPAGVRQRTRLLVLDTLACAVAGLRYPDVAALASAAAEVSPGTAQLPGLAQGSGAPSLPRVAKGPGDAQPPSSAQVSGGAPRSGVAQGLAPVAAAAVFTSAAVWDEFCEGFDTARGRPGLHSVGLPLMLAEQQGLTVGEVLFAVLAGYEVGARFGAALFTLEGLHVDGSWGTAAAAAAAAVALRLDESRFAEAVGIATATPVAPLYLSVPRGATARNIYAARGVAGGLDCAVAAAAGLTAPEGAVAATVGLLGRTGSGALPEPGDFLLPKGYLKPWPGVRHAHYAIEAALQYRRRGQVAVPADAPIRLVMHPAAVEYAGVRAPTNRLQAQFSCTYAAARTLATGIFDLSAYTADALSDPAVRALEQRIELVAGPPGGRYAELEIGQQRHRADSAAGVGLPVEEVRAKARALLAPSFGDAGAAAVVEWILTADESEPWQLPV